jgi:hypothetical protein
MHTLASCLSSIAPGTPVEARKEPPVSAFFSKKCPLLRLVTGLCEGADAVAAEALTKVNAAFMPGSSSQSTAAPLPLLTAHSALLLLNHHRSAVQRAADALWPWALEASRPTRKTYDLPLTRPLNL